MLTPEESDDSKGKTVILPSDLYLIPVLNTVFRLLRTVEVSAAQTGLLEEVSRMVNTVMHNTVLQHLTHSDGNARLVPICSRVEEEATLFNTVFFSSNTVFSLSLTNLIRY